MSSSAQQDILYDRAVAVLLDKLDMTLSDVGKLPQAQQKIFADSIDEVIEELKYYKLKHYHPFDYQLEFHAAGGGILFEFDTDILLADERLSYPYKYHPDGSIVVSQGEPKHTRMSLGSTRSGKTVSTSNETALHLSGLYSEIPFEWPGRVFKLPVTWWIFGESWRQVARVTQKELMGTSDIRDVDKIGTGTIPRHLIDIDRIQKDGPNALVVPVKHITGGYSELHFFNYNQLPDDLQGAKVDGITMDECPPDKIYNEASNRTTITNQGDGVIGELMFSFVPLKGKTNLVNRFLVKEAGFWYRRITLFDVPEYDYYGTPVMPDSVRDETIARITDPLEIDPRVYGIPKAGAGSRFPWGLDKCAYKDGDVELQIWWDHMRGLDASYAKDATVVTWLAYDERRDTVYVYRTDTYRHRVLPQDYAPSLIKDGLGEIPVAWYYDITQEARYTGSTKSLYDELSSYGVRMCRDGFHNPPDQEGKVNTLRKTGEAEIALRLRNGTLRIHESCTELMEELSNAHYDEKTGKPVGQDDHIDSLRYGIMMLLQGYGVPANGMSKAVHQQEKFRNARDSINRSKDVPKRTSQDRFKQIRNSMR